MAFDAAGLPERLEHPAAHVAGASMGGMIAQLFALQHPEKTLTLTSVMSNLGGADSGPRRPRGGAVLLPPPATREERIEQTVGATRVTWGPSFEEERARARATRAIDRSFYPEGRSASSTRSPPLARAGRGLGRVRMPVLVIHGDADPWLPFANAERTVGGSPGSRAAGMKGGRPRYAALGVAKDRRWARPAGG